MGGMTDTKTNMMTETRIAMTSGQKKLTDTFHHLSKMVYETKLVKTTMVNPVISFFVLGILFLAFILGCYFVLK